MIIEHKTKRKSRIFKVANTRGRKKKGSYPISSPVLKNFLVTRRGTLYSLRLAGFRVPLVHVLNQIVNSSSFWELFY